MILNCSEKLRKLENLFLQDDIDKLVKCSEKWQMLFNFEKCKCLHTGPGNTGMNYEIFLQRLSVVKMYTVQMKITLMLSINCL